MTFMFVNLSFYRIMTFCKKLIIINYDLPSFVRYFFENEALTSTIKFMTRGFDDLTLTFYETKP